MKSRAMTLLRIIVGLGTIGVASGRGGGAVERVGDAGEEGVVAPRGFTVHHTVFPAV